VRLFSFGGYGLALAALPLVVFGAYDSYHFFSLQNFKSKQKQKTKTKKRVLNSNLARRQFVLARRSYHRHLAAECTNFATQFTVLK